MAAVIEIKARKPRGFWSKYKPDKTTLERLYIKNGLTATQIANILSKKYGTTIPKHAVEYWLKHDELYTPIQRQRKKKVTVVKFDDDKFFDTILHIRDIKDKKAREFLKDEAIKYYYDIIA